MRLGIIGTGQIGGMLASAYAGTNLYHLTTINRTRSKADAIREKYPEQVSVATTTEAVIEYADVLFLCLKSADTRTWLANWGQLLDENQILISTSSQVALSELESQSLALAAKVIPSVTQTALTGYILYTTGQRFDESTRDTLHQLLARIGNPLAIAENETRIYADLTSCGPAFFAFIVQLMATAAEHKGVPAVTAESILVETMDGLIRLLKEKEYSLQEVIQKISVPGGVTEAGIDLLRTDAPLLFTDLFDATARRHRDIDAAT